jgi:hypothetical protein
MKSTGHINVARSIFDHPMFDDGKPLSDREAWLWLISNAAWRQVQIMVRNGRSSEMLNLERGQLSFSRSFLRKAWRWTSEKRVRTFLNRLERECMVDLLTGQLQTVISICNYGVFQSGGQLTGPSNGPAMGRQWASKGPAMGQKKKTLKALETIYSRPQALRALMTGIRSIPERKNRRRQRRHSPRLLAPP